MSNYASSCVDFMHHKAPLHDGIAHAMTPADWARLKGAGFKVEIRKEEPLFKDPNARGRGRPRSPQIYEIARKVIALGDNIKRGMATAICREANVNYRSALNLVHRMRLQARRNKTASLGGRRKYVIMLADLKPHNLEQCA